MRQQPEKPPLKPGTLERRGIVILMSFALFVVCVSVANISKYSSSQGFLILGIAVGIFMICAWLSAQLYKSIPKR